jgi:hypothetical protein
MVTPLYFDSLACGSSVVTYCTLKRSFEIYKSVSLDRTYSHEIMAVNH